MGQKRLLLRRKNFKKLQEEISSIVAIPAKQCTAEQNKRLKNLKKKEKKIAPQFQHLNLGVKSTPMTAAEWKADLRAKQDLAAKEVENAAAKAQMA